MKVVVIGAGVAGLSIGWRLAQAGADVTLLERAQPGHGATWASAGMIATAAEIQAGNSPEAQFARRSAASWPEFAREIEGASGMEIGYRTDGTLLIARGEKEAAQLRARATDAAPFLPAADALSLEPLLASDIEGALFHPEEAQVDNRALGPALAVALRRAGGRLRSHEAVVRIEIANGRAAAVRTPFAVYGADAFVLAAGAWSGGIEGLPPEAVPPIVPVKGEMIALTAAADVLPRHMIWGNEVYLVSRGGRLLIGATVTRDGFDTRTTKAAAEWLLGRAEQLIPALANWSVVEHWAGLRPGSPDDLPLIGPSALEGLFIASGQYRNGILFAPAVAETMRDILLDARGPEYASAFDPRRFAG